MKYILLLLIISNFILCGCQKSLSYTGSQSDNGTDSTILPNDTLTYEIITKDTGGWYGIWMDENSDLAGTGLDSGAWGNALYYESGWKYSFVPKHAPFQMMMSVDARSYTEDIAINFYRNGELVKSQTNSPIKGFAKLLYNAVNDSAEGTVEDPLVTYEVLVDDMDTTKFECDGWMGQWVGTNGYNISLDNPLAMALAIPSGWKYSFHPKQLPFTMSMQATPYTAGGGRVTINFYVNGVLVKTTSSYEWIYEMKYDL